LIRISCFPLEGEWRGRLDAVPAFEEPPHATVSTNTTNNREPSWSEGTATAPFLGRVLSEQARINPRINPGHQTLLAYLPDRDIDLAVLCNEEAPSLHAALSQLHLP
jgi:hypothetical protein